jgi:hypothetical protein
METKKKQPKTNVWQEPSKEIDFKSIPDPKNHQLFSFLKSSVRITGYIALPFGIGLGVFILVLSELIGIIEELV